MKYTIKINRKDHLIAWLRFIQENRPKKRVDRRDIYEFDFTSADFLMPYHLTSLACLIEEYKMGGAKIYFKSKRKTMAGTYLKYTKFDKYWSLDFDRNFCFSSDIENTLPIWKYEAERINAFADRAQDFYVAHCLPGKDLTPLRLTVVEALNNVNDHSESRVGGFVTTQFYPSQSELMISICDFGKGIPNKVNTFMRKTGQKPLSYIDALELALKLGFTTKSTPNNGGFGLDMILSNVKANDGEIQIISNKAFYSKRIKDGIPHSTVKDNTQLSFGGTFLMIRLKTSRFQDVESSISDEMFIL